jgi:hypothetical protein
MGTRPEELRKKKQKWRNFCPYKDQKQVVCFMLTAVLLFERRIAATNRLLGSVVDDVKGQKTMHIGLA